MSRFLSPLHRPTLGALVVDLMLCATTYAQTFPSKPLKLAKVVKANNVKVE